MMKMIRIDLLLRMMLNDADVGCREIGPSESVFDQKFGAKICKTRRQLGPGKISFFSLVERGFPEFKFFFF